MAITTDTNVVRIAIADDLDLKKAIKQECDLQASREKHRRLAASFTYKEELILIFQRTPD
jgi:hypothetical protein